MGVELLNLDLLLILVCVVEHDDLHGALKLSRILEVHDEAALTEFVVRVLSGLLKLSIELLELSSWRCLRTLLSYFVGSTRCLYLKVNLDILLFFALWLKNTFVSHVFLVLYTFLLIFESFLLLLQEFFIVLLCLLIGLDVSCRLATSSFTFACLSCCLFGYVLQNLFYHFFGLLFLCK